MADSPTKTRQPDARRAADMIERNEEIRRSASVLQQDFALILRTAA